MMCTTKARFGITGCEMGASELEIETTVFNGKVCVLFKCTGTTAHRTLVETLRGMHEDKDPSIRQVSDDCTMNTRFSEVADLIESLRTKGYRCREIPTRS